MGSSQSSFDWDKHIKNARRFLHRATRNVGEHMKHIRKHFSPPKPKRKPTFVKPAGPKKVGGFCKPCPKGEHRGEVLLQTGACPPCRAMKKPETPMKKRRAVSKKPEKPKAGWTTRSACEE